MSRSLPVPSRSVKLGSKKSSKHGKKLMSELKQGVASPRCCSNSSRKLRLNKQLGSVVTRPDVAVVRLRLLRRSLALN